MIDIELKEEPNSCNHFVVDSELQKGRQCLFNFAKSSFKMSFPIEKLDHVFNQLNCAAKTNIAFGFVLKNLEALKMQRVDTFMHTQTKQL